MAERKLVVPGIYKHFKNKLYCTVGISSPSAEQEQKSRKMETYHTEKMVALEVSQHEDGTYTHDSNTSNETLVLYKSLYDDTGIYARPLEMFLSLVDGEKYPLAEQEYRMQLIGGLFKENILGMLKDVNLLDDKDMRNLERVENEDDYELVDDYGDLFATNTWNMYDYDYEFSASFNRNLARELFRFLGYPVSEA